MMRLEMYTQAGTFPSGRTGSGPAVKGRSTWPGLAAGEAVRTYVARTRKSAGSCWMALGHANAIAARRGPLESPI
jgi:hypothetical protein